MRRTGKEAGDEFYAPRTRRSLEGASRDRPDALPVGHKRERPSAGRAEERPGARARWLVRLPAGAREGEERAGRVPPGTRNLRRPHHARQTSSRGRGGEELIPRRHDRQIARQRNTVYISRLA